jgi:hypothetical protein
MPGFPAAPSLSTQVRTPWLQESHTRRQRSTCTHDFNQGGEGQPEVSGSIPGEEVLSVSVPIRRVLPFRANPGYRCEPTVTGNPAYRVCNPYGSRKPSSCLYLVNRSIRRLSIQTLPRPFTDLKQWPSPTRRAIACANPVLASGPHSPLHAERIDVPMGGAPLAFRSGPRWYRTTYAGIHRAVVSQSAESRRSGVSVPCPRSIAVVKSQDLGLPRSAASELDAIKHRRPGRSWRQAAPAPAQ